MRKNWDEILQTAKGIVDSYDTPVTLRQLFYRLVSQEILKNTRSEYTALSNRTAKARREGWFPSFIDRTREIYEKGSFDGPREAHEWLVGVYRRDRTENQPWSIYLGVEKEGIVEQLSSWFGRLGIPILALSGYSSQSYVEEIVDHVRRQARPAVLIYAGDFDPSGEDIERDFRERTDCFTESTRIALTPEQIETYDLPPQMGKATDTRAAGFVKKYGELVQVELDALPPDILRELYQAEVDRYFDRSTFNAVVEQEQRERAILREAFS
jgi:hypothetical protein